MSGTEAVVNGFIYNHGLPAYFWFKWGRTKAYGHIAFNGEEDAFNGKRPVAVEEVLFGLRAHTTYHYRLVAYTAGGKSYGRDRTFHTQSR